MQRIGVMKRVIPIYSRESKSQKNLDTILSQSARSCKEECDLQVNYCSKIFLIPSKKPKQASISVSW